MATKHDRLTEREMDGYHLPEPWLAWLAAHCERTGRARDDVRVLDWGCGRGRAVAALLGHGYDAVGVDVDPATLDNGRDLLAGRGHDPDARLLRVEADGRVPLADRSCHAIFSDQVLEHVEGLDAIARELARLTADDGFGLHVFPSHRRVVEPHLDMPFVHWLPKNGLRRIAIGWMLRWGRDPRWRELDALPARERLQCYFDYSVGRTWYRSPTALRRILGAVGLDPVVLGTGGRSRFLARAKKLPVLRDAAEWWQCTFDSTWLVTGRAPLPDR